MSIVIKGIDMPEGNSTKNLLIYSDGRVFTGHKYDANYFAEELSEGINYVKFSEEDYEKIAEQLRKIPIVLTLSEPEIIRCKDCKHYKFADNRAFGFPVRRCEWTGFEDIDDDDFCSRAERREE